MQVNFDIDALRRPLLTITIFLPLLTIISLVLGCALIRRALFLDTEKDLIHGVSASDPPTKRGSLLQATAESTRHLSLPQNELLILLWVLRLRLLPGDNLDRVPDLNSFLMVLEPLFIRCRWRRAVLRLVLGLLSLAFTLRLPQHR